MHDRRFRSRDGRRKNKVAVQEPGVITKIDEEPATAGFDRVGTRIRGGGGELEGKAAPQLLVMRGRGTRGNREGKTRPGVGKKLKRKKRGRVGR